MKVDAQFFFLIMLSMSILDTLLEPAAHSEHGVLIRYNIGAKTIECSRIECPM
jgi:hypothetical protein